MKPALFLDRDGVINEEVDYLYRIADCRLVPGIASLIRTANQHGYLVVIITNQSGIARGLYSESDFQTLMDHIRAELARQDARIDGVYFSPYHPAGTVPAYTRESPCRKPAPGMLLQAAGEHGIDLANSVLVGDRCSDLQAGHAAGVQQLFLFGNTEAAPCPQHLRYSRVGYLSLVESTIQGRSPHTLAAR